jgi:hypothetical protein
LATGAGVLVVVLVFLAVGPVVVLGRLLVRIRVARPLGTLAGPGELLVLQPGDRDQLVDPLCVFRQHVGDELERGSVPQPDQPAHLGPDDAGSAAQRLGGLLALLGRTEDGVVHLGLAQVVGQPRLGHGDEAQPRVLDPALKQLSDDLGDAFRETSGAGVVHCRSLPFSAEECLAARLPVPGTGRLLLVGVEPLPCRQQLDLWMGRHQALALVEHLAGVPCAAGHHRYPDLRSPMQVKMTGLGDRDPGVPAAQLGHERPDDGPLLFQRADVAQQHVQRHGGYVHRGR